MTQLRPRTVVLVSCAISMLLLAGVAPVTADHNSEDRTIGESLAGDGDRLEAIRGAANGLLDRATYRLSTIRDESATANESRDDALEAFNDHSDAFLEYANERDIHDGEVVEVTFHQDGDEATLFIIGEYDDEAGEYTNFEAVESTDRDVDHEIRLEGQAAERAAAEIEYFYDAFAASDEDVTAEYTATMAARYAGNVEEPFTEDD